MIRKLAFSIGLIAAMMAACADDPGRPVQPADSALQADVGNESNGPRLVMTASWATSYGSVQELFDAAAVVVVGEVQTARSDPGKIPQTYFTVAVAESLKGRPPGSFEVKQTGGTLSGASTEVLGDPLMKLGETYLLFLLKSPGGTLYVAGGPQGRFVVNGESFTPLRTDDSHVDSTLAGGKLSAIRDLARP